MVRGLAIFLNIPVLKSVHDHLDDSVCLDFLCGDAISPAHDDDEREAHAAFLVESECFGVLDCGATTSFGSGEGAGALFSKSHEHDTRIPDVDPFGGRMVPRARPLHCPNSQSEMMLLVNSGSLCICSLTNRNRLH